MESVSSRDSSRQALRAGVEMELSREWLKAINHYEDAIKTWPDSRDLEHGLRRSKIHFGIVRRYADESFETRLLKKSTTDALSLFNDVLGRVRENYVDPLSSTSFVSHGTESFYLALANDRFREAHLPKADWDDIQDVRRILREKYWNKRISYQGGAEEIVREVMEIAHDRLGMSRVAVVMEYLFGGCNALDDYSNFLTPNRLDDLYGNIDGEFVGIGIEIKAEKGKGLLLVNVLDDSPAERGGATVGDFIVAIDGVNCRSMSTDEAARLLRGPSGSMVRLSLKTPDVETTRNRAFVRRSVQVKSIPVAKIVDQERGIAYLKLATFQKSSAGELDDALNKLRGEGMRKLIWDVRGNPGGLLTAAVEVLDRFIPEGTLVSTRGRTQDQNWRYSASRPGTWDVPLVLLTDGDSASASEIVAGAIRDHGRGVIVGRQTYGKWSVQSIFPVRQKTGLRLTTAKFYSPNDHTLGKIGVAPDIKVEKPKERTAFYRGRPGQDVADDADIQKAIEVFKHR
ncbi:MAG: S41 family peptidase [Planctomycetota bacterium]|nr:S41 family peptidase [Planctomycetota bacterium]